MTGSGVGASLAEFSTMIAKLRSNRLIISTLPRTLLLISLLTLAACSTAPVQEMSDARIAIRSAEDAGALVHAPAQLGQARQLLDLAEAKIAAGAYDDARRFALGARDNAIRARERASSATNP